MSILDEWSPSRNVLQLILDYFPLSYTPQYGNKTFIQEIIREHEELIGAVEGGLTMNMRYEIWVCLMSDLLSGK